MSKSKKSDGLAATREAEIKAIKTALLADERIKPALELFVEGSAKFVAGTVKGNNFHIPSLVENGMCWGEEYENAMKALQLVMTSVIQQRMPIIESNKGTDPLGLATVKNLPVTRGQEGGRKVNLTEAGRTVVAEIFTDALNTAIGQAKQNLKSEHKTPPKVMDEPSTYTADDLGFKGGWTLRAASKSKERKRA